jgi:hypothetical protein
MIVSLLGKLSGLVLFSRLRQSSLAAFIVLSFLPFLGVIWFDWEPIHILAAYFIDRLLYLLFFQITNIGMQIRGRKNGLAGRIFRIFFELFVGGYMLLGLLFFVLSLSGDFFKSTTFYYEFFQLTVAIALLYLIPCVQTLRLESPETWKSKDVVHTVGIVLLSGAVFMISFVGGVMLIPVFSNSFFSSFFGSGYGIVMFLFVLLRMVSDMLFFKILGD